MRKILIAVLFLTCSLYSQVINPTTINGGGPGNFNFTGAVTCTGLTCNFTGGGGGGSVTSFSSGNLSPLFTTSVANPTSTPALSFSLSNAASNTIFGNWTGSSGAPSFNAVPSCSSTGNVIQQTAGTGLTCHTIAAGDIPATLSSTSSMGTSCTVNAAGTVTGVCGADTNTLNDGSGNASITGKIAAANMKDTGVTASSIVATDSTSTLTAATAAGIVAAIGSTAVTNATNATNATEIGGITITGTPSVGYVPTATSSSVATWQAASGATTNQNIRPIRGEFDGGGLPLVAPQTVCSEDYVTGFIQQVDINAMQTGSATVDVRTVSLSSFRSTGPSASTSIAASDIPQYSSGYGYTDTSLTGWTYNPSTAIPANTVFCFYLTAASNVQHLELVLKVAAN